MKRVLLAAIIASFMCLTRVSAQQEPRYSHFMFNTLNYNPAYAGTRDGICGSILYHNQWTGFDDPDGAISPLTQTASINAPLPFIGVKKESPLQGEMGIGMNIINDKIGFEGMTGVNITPSYIFKHLWSQAKISVGLNLGLLQESVDPKWVARDPGDPRLPGQTSDMLFDAGAGVYVVGGNWFGGLSSTHLNKATAKWKANGGGTVDFSVVPAYFLTGGYTKPIGGNLELQGYGMWEKEGVKSSVSLAALALYKQLVYGGLEVRFEKLTAASVLVGFYPPQVKNLLLGLSWDVPTAYTKSFGGTPEIFARYCFSVTIPPVEEIWYKSSRWL
jgi:type IX secretion system PorP/SprF family membrane protein